jgi:peptidoglycan-associated lipoprotein
MERHTLMHVAAILAGVGILVGGWACASRQTSSGSEGQSTTAKDKGAVETVQPPQLAAVPPPDSGAATVPSARHAEESPAPDTRASQFTSSAPPGSTAPIDVAGLGDIFFDFDRYNIRKDAEPVLQGNALWLRREAGRTFVIEGHCDERGTLAYNLVLGEKRAKSAKRFLQELGIPASRLRTTSYGEVRPFCKDHNEGCWQKNRRAHFAVQ